MEISHSRFVPHEWRYAITVFSLPRFPQSWKSIKPIPAAVPAKTPAQLVKTTSQALRGTQKQPARVERCFSPPGRKPCGKIAILLAGSTT
jgi:hypothetical protein